MNFRFPSSTAPSIASMPGPMPFTGAFQDQGFGSMASYGTGLNLPSTAGPSPAGMSVPSTQGTTGMANPVGAPTDLSFMDRMKGTFMTKDGGFDLGAIGNLAETIGSFGNLWAGFQANKIAKDSLNYQKRAYDTNLANQISSYNLALEDRMRSRYAQNNRSEAEAMDKVNQHKLGS